MDNWKAIAYLLAFGQGFVLCLSLIARSFGGRRAGLFLGLILLVLCQELLNAWGMQVHYHSRPDAIPFWNWQSYLVLPLATWFFMRLTTEPGYVFKPKYGSFFLPVAVEIAIRCAWSFYRNTLGVEIPSLLDNAPWFFVTEILPIMGMVAVLGIYGRRLSRIHSGLKTHGGERSARTWFRFYGLFSFLSLLTILWIAGVIFEWPVFSGIELLLALCLSGLGYIGYISPDFFTLPALPKPKQPEKPDFARFDDRAEFQRLRDVFLRDQLHTRSGLTLDEVAGHLQLPPRYISYLINAHSNTNFNGFVNGFRVEEVIRKLADPGEQHKTILALAFESGFNSKSTFNQVFKQHTGKSPSEFMLVQK
ncbi:helix-turn-helix domain-containing protein [Dyadobacter fermentans]|uniref:Transcriptional regulator, AraC family n=1 Tax=Dyadobacter fermentans (strain ATCC 700827 / DSM 18053 / CIP 107007 / KCTC 52180 / NS114) TaxID=471854 RepID=C6W0G2_DYAFD|nr:AraC family transcriptional regulator [Dyadobacter fermentans]ACT91896.1 transcriptional regulator, AraC family [Dyadobacter fermentans DSM 18053]